MRTGYASKCIPVIIAAALLASCSGEKKEAAAADEKVKVKVEAVHIEDVEQLYEFTATVTANASNRIAPQAPARIEKLHVEVGDRVKAGQLLATMDATTLNQLKIQMENQEIEFNRVDELYKVGGVSKSAWDAQKAQLDISRNTYKNLEENNKLASPVSGVVTARNYDNGDMYNGATPVYVVEQFSPVKLMVNVSESYYTKVAKGMDVDIRLDVYAGETFSGKVFLVYPTIDAATRTFPVEIRIPNNDQRVRPGMFARVVMNFGTIRRVVASDRAVVKQPGSGDRYMYVCRDGRVSYNKVELGRRMGDRYEVVSGVEDGDQVVVTGLNRLTDGQEVIVVR
ncbi:MAG: efflux RND transporter periplasmic adaptor subunit [Tannerellaceae bacterium]|jgi:RND family efflux transporter MFP subunit|nr:efflux RND transporter periplasmic adaptor subunit [Tannerellaceae bacterium]